MFLLFLHATYTRIHSLGCVASERWSGYHGEWGGYGGGEAGYYPGVEIEPGERVRREAGFSSFHIRRGDFQYKKVRGVLFRRSFLT